MSSDGAHLVVHAFGHSPGVAFDAIQGIGMRQDPNLPCAFGRPGQDGGLFFDGAGIERTRQGCVAQRFPLSQNNPALRDGISSDFHAGFFSAPNGPAVRKEERAKKRKREGKKKRPAIHSPNARPCAVVCFPVGELSSKRATGRGVRCALCVLFSREWTPIWNSCSKQSRKRAPRGRPARCL